MNQAAECTPLTAKVLEIRAYVQIQTVITGKMLHPGRLLVFDLEIGKYVSESIRYKNPAWLKPFIEEAVRERAQKEFLALMKSDPTVKHHVGGVRWKVGVMNPEYEFK
jgi:hypothetical protein